MEVKVEDVCVESKYDYNVIDRYNEIVSMYEALSTFEKVDLYVKYISKQILSYMNLNFCSKSPLSHDVSYNGFISDSNISIIDTGEDWKKHYRACRYYIETSGIFSCLDSIRSANYMRRYSRERELEAKISKQNKVIQALWQYRKLKQQEV
ncbi:MAG: hypothetical protein ACRCXN_10695 [Bacteroidales bacterium]